jgi:hypothetical protein
MQLREFFSKMEFQWLIEILHEIQQQGCQAAFLMLIVEVKIRPGCLALCMTNLVHIARDAGPAEVLFSRKEMGDTIS